MTQRFLADAFEQQGRQTPSGMPPPGAGGTVLLDRFSKVMSDLQHGMNDRSRGLDFQRIRAQSFRRSRRPSDFWLTQFEQQSRLTPSGMPPGGLGVRGDFKRGVAPLLSRLTASQS